jgi:hypothetical protein
LVLVIISKTSPTGLPTSLHSSTTIATTNHPFFLNHTDDAVYETASSRNSDSSGLMVLAGTAAQRCVLLHDYQSLLDDDTSIVGLDESVDNEREATTKDSEMINHAKDGSGLLKIIDMLPNSANHYGNSLTMNAIIKILCQHEHFKKPCDILLATKVKNGKEISLPSMFNIVCLSWPVDSNITALPFESTPT